MPDRITQLLESCSQRDTQAAADLLPLVYDELRSLARSYLAGERRDHTLQATALVHEAYLRLVRQEEVRWQNRAHFFAIAAQLMRRILVDYARSRQREKRGGGFVKVSLAESIDIPQRTVIDLVALDHALDGLAKLDSQQSQIVEIRFFGGLSIQETAEALGISPATVKRDWVTAKAWLFHEMTRNTRL